MDTSLLTWYQALQLMALGPCLFIIFFLCVTACNFSKIIVPVLYFASLSCSFIIPITDIFEVPHYVNAVLLAGKSCNVALSFLLIIEFITGNMPAPPYWLIFAIPLIGGGPIDYVTTLTKGEICIYENVCASPIIFKQFYEIFGSSLIFLLTVFLYNRLSAGTENNDYQSQNKRAIIFSLILLNLLILSVKLAFISGRVSEEQAGMAATVVRMGFIYLVMTFVFRVFDDSFEIAYERVPTLSLPSVPTERDMQLADNIRKILAEEKIYRSMELNREILARKLAVTENHLSRVINMCFSQNFNALINSYRLEEAKKRLASENTAITTIAFEVGFNSIPSFYRVFKQVTSMSPSEYRSQNASKNVA